MNDAHLQTTSIRRRSGALVAIAAAVGGIFAATLAQLAGAPAAHADVAALINELEGTYTIGQTALQEGSTALMDGNLPLALDYDFGALDTYALSALGDVVYGGYESLLGVAGPYQVLGFPYVADPLPTTLTAATSEYTADITAAQSEFGAAATALAAGDFTTGAFDTFYGIGEFVEAPETEIIGLVDALSGSF